MKKNLVREGQVKKKSKRPLLPTDDGGGVNIAQVALSTVLLVLIGVTVVYDLAGGLRDSAREEEPALSRVSPEEKAPQSWDDMGEIQTLMMQGDFDRIELILRETARAEPSCAMNQYRLGRFLLEQMRFEEAREALDAAVSIEPGSARFHTFLAMVHSGLNQPEKAEEELLEAVKLDFDYLTAQYNLGMLYLLQGRPAEAEVCLDQALALSPTNLKVREALVRLEAAKGAD